MAQGYDEKDAKSIEAFAKKLEGSTLKKAVLQEGRSIPEEFNALNKGMFGLTLEKYFFGIENNNRAEADFPAAGVELKATPVQENGKKEISSKERLVLGNINYSTVASESFEFSRFFHKAELLLLVFYVYKKDEIFFDHLISLTSLWKIPSEDLEQIIRDWNYVVELVKKNKAHTITSGATLYLEACPGGGKKTAPYMQSNGIEARRRRFALKPAYMTTVFHSLKKEKLITLAPKEGRTPDEEIRDRFHPFIGMRASEIAAKLGLKFNEEDKGRFNAFSRAILGAGRYQDIVELKKSNTLIKTIRASRSGIPVEHVSFPAFKFSEIIDEKWEPEDEEEVLPAGYKDILQSRFLFVIFRCADVDCQDPVLEEIKFWTMPESDLEGPVKRMWEEAVEAIRNSQPKALPGITHENGVAHVRPHGALGKDVDILPDGTTLTKQCFWLNAPYLTKQLDIHPRE